MLISSWFISCIFLLIQSLICSTLQDSPIVEEESSKQVSKETNTYGFHHPPEPELNVQKGLRKEKSLSVDEKTPPVSSRPQSRQLRRKPTASSASLKIPVQVIYETEPTTVRPYPKSASTSSPSNKTTRVIVRRKQIQSKRNKNIDIRQVTNSTSTIDTTNVTEDTQTLTDKKKNDVSSSTDFLKRSRGSYFEKRREPPAPKTKILEEKNFVFAHSGNFHYSYLGDDGTKISSEGSLKSYDNNKTGEAVSGSVFYTDDDGNDYSLSYTADEKGYRPVGAHLPTPPPIPPAIARALKYIADMSTPSPTADNE